MIVTSESFDVVDDDVYIDLNQLRVIGSLSCDILPSPLLSSSLIFSLPFSSSLFSSSPFSPFSSLSLSRSSAHTIHALYFVGSHFIKSLHGTLCDQAPYSSLLLPPHPTP